MNAKKAVKVLTIILAGVTIIKLGVELYVLLKYK